MYSNSFLTYTYGVLQESTLALFKCYRLLLALRLTLIWFPYINPFIEPYYSLTLLTDPYLRIFRELIPRFFSIDISPFFAVLWVQSIIEIIAGLVFNNYY